MADVPAPPGAGPTPPPPPDRVPTGGLSPSALPYSPQLAPTDALGRPLAEGWKRFLAAAIDGFLMLAVSFVIGFVLVFVDLANAPGGSQVSNPFTFSWVTTAISWGIPFLYFAILNALPRGQSAGKLIMGIQLRDERTGGPVGLGKSILRALLILLMIFLCYLPAILSALFPLWDPKRQTLDDKATGTICIDISRSGPQPSQGV